MDSKRFNIYAGSILGGLLLFLLLNFFSSLLYYGPEHAGHEEEVLAFAVPVEEEAGAPAEAEEVDLAALAAEADPAAGEKVFNKCKACHALDEGQHGVGPSLHNVVGAAIAGAPGYSYSGALTELEGEWTLEDLSAFLENPAGYAPGTKMAFAGLADPEDRVNVIAYLNEADGTPIELAPPQAAEAEPAAEPASAEGEQAAAEPAAEEPAAEQPAAEETAAEETAAEGTAAEGTAAEQPTETAAAEQEAEQPAEGAAGAATGGEYADLLASASAENGEKVFRKCQACHTLDEGKHRVGPSLHGVIGRDVGAAEGYSYSDAMANFEGDWTLPNLMGYLEKPNEFMPGNKMSFAGLKDPQDRIDVFTYIDQADGERELPQP